MPRAIRDLLPSPAERAFREKDVKIAIAIGKRGADSFKEGAARNDMQYQRAIRRLLDAYVEARAGAPTRRSSRTARTRAAGRFER